MVRLTAYFAIGLFACAYGQIPVPQAQVKISDQPFPVANAQQLNQVVWTVLGTTSQETIYCVSEAPVSQLRFVCIDCLQRNITDMVDILSSAQDLTRSAGFPTVSLRNVVVNPNWTGAQIMCQAALNGATIDSAPAVIDVRYLRQPHVVDQSGQGPILRQSQGYRFYVECVRGADGSCQPGSRRKTLRCAVQAHPPATVYRWLRNGVPTSGNGAEITIGTEMIGQSIQCAANNGLYSDADMPSSQAVQIDPYTAARLVQDNFQKIQPVAPFQPGNRIEMNQQINLGCQVEGHPRPVVFWKLRRPNGQVVDAPCPQGFEGQNAEVELPRMPSNIVRLNALCALRISNYSYSGQYWCSACSYVSQGTPECSPSLDAPGQNTLSVHVQGPPMQSDIPPTVDQSGENAVVTVNFCAEPAPHPPRDVIFSIDQNDIQIGQSWDKFRFEGMSQNNSTPNCYSVRLLISDDVPSHQVVLKLQNQYGQKHISVPLDDLLGGSGLSSGEMSGWVIAILVFIGVGLLVSVILVCCVRKHLFCFNQVKSTESTYTDGKPTKSNLNVHENYSDDMNGSAGRTVYSSHGNKVLNSTMDNGYPDYHDHQSPYDAALKAAFSDSRMSSV